MSIIRISLLLLAVDFDVDIVDVNGVVDVNVVVDDNVVVVKANRAVVDFVVVVVDTVVVSRKISIVGFKVGGNLVFKHRPFLITSSSHVFMNPECANLFYEKIIFYILSGYKESFSNFSCMFLNPNIFFQFEF